MSDDARNRMAAYREAASRAASEREREDSKSRVVSYLRIACFVAAAAGLAAALPFGGRGSFPLVAAGVVAFVAFLVLVFVHSRIEERQRWFAIVADLNLESAARLARDWERLPAAAIEAADPHHPFADDVDVLGHASVFKLVGSVGSEAGRRTLRQWLLSPASPADIVRRQEAVRELAPRAGFRERLAARGRLIGVDTHDLDRFFEWAEGPRWFTTRGWLPWVFRILTAASAGLLALHAGGAVSGPLWLYPAAISLAAWGVCGRRIHQTFTRAFSRQRLFHQYAGMFALLDRERFEAPLLVDLQSRLRRSGLAAEIEMARLDRLKQLSDLRFQALFHLPINVLTCWDFHVVDALERWQERVGPGLREWFSVLGEADALCALAALAHDNPTWAFPEVRPGLTTLEARGLGHPLIPDDRRVANDVTVGPPGTVLLVTGSNMSGKSTLLRAIGSNVVLAQAGAPVCALEFRMPPAWLCTSMRVRDSLEEGVSYFMAALQRLKLVVDAARRTPPGPPGLIYLLDEILQGTNTAERQIAVRRILHHLLSLPVVGAVTTHDLELAGSPELAASCRAVHFTEGVEGRAGEARLSFDYRLRPGVATSRNALKLLELVGLDADAPHGSATADT